ncbi:MAG: NAD(P)/FAD-dependent oxidoreductase [Chloroflexota bacterium]
MTSPEPTSQDIVVAGAGYAGLHVAQRMGGWLRRHPEVNLTVVDERDHHELVVELPRVATGTREEHAVRVPLDGLLGPQIHYKQVSVTGFDLPGRRLLANSGPIPYSLLVVALGSRSNDFHIPGLAERVLTPYSAEEAQAVWDAVNESVQRAASAQSTEEQQRLMTIVIGGGGSTGVELAGGFAEELPELARKYGVPPERSRVILVEAGHTILAGSSPDLIAKAGKILRDLGVQVRTNSIVAAGTPSGLELKSGETIEGGVFVWAGGVKAPSVVQGCGFEIGYNGRIKVDQYLRALDHTEVFVAGDMASVVDPSTGRALSPLAQTAIEEGESVARNLQATLEGQPLKPFKFMNKGFVVSVGGRTGVAEVAGLTIGGRLAHMLKDSIEWEYRQSVKHLRGWGAA